MGIVGVVGEAVVFFLRIVQQQAKLHALAGEFAVGQRAHAGEDGRDAGVGFAVDEVLAGGAAFLPIIDHVLQVGNQQVARRLQILRAAIAIATGAVGKVVVRIGPLAG